MATWAPLNSFVKAHLDAHTPYIIAPIIPNIWNIKTKSSMAWLPILEYKDSVLLSLFIYYVRVQLTLQPHYNNARISIFYKQNAKSNSKALLNQIPLSLKKCVGVANLRVLFELCEVTVYDHFITNVGKKHIKIEIFIFIFKFNDLLLIYPSTYLEKEKETNKINGKKPTPSCNFLALFYVLIENLTY